MVFAGDEVGVGGSTSDAGRQPFPWDESTWDHDLLATYRRLIALRRDVDALRRGGHALRGRQRRRHRLRARDGRRDACSCTPPGRRTSRCASAAATSVLTGDAPSGCTATASWVVDAARHTARRRTGVQRVADLVTGPDPERRSPTPVGCDGTLSRGRATTSSTRRSLGWARSARSSAAASRTTARWSSRRSSASAAAMP